jgi:ligand-binding sensor domain-containing protein/putative methionine-R-sulfoxide reductase with GAF domain
MAEDGSGDLWLACAKGLAKFAGGDRRLLYENKPLDLVSFLDKNWQSATALTEQAIIKLSVNKNADLLLGTIGSVHYYSKGILKKLWQKQENSDFVTSVHIDQLGYCTWGTALVGINTWNGSAITSYNENNKIGLYGAYELFETNDTIKIFSLVNIFSYQPSANYLERVAFIHDLDIKWPTCMLVDREGNFWLGSHEGIYYLKKNSFARYTSNRFRSIQEVYSIYQTRDNKLLAGTNRGLVYQIGRDSALPFLDRKTVVPRAEVFAIYEDDKDWLWFGTGYQGISVYRNGQIENFRVEDGLTDNTNYSFYRDAKKQLWSIGDNGITRIVTDSAKRISFQKFSASFPNAQDYKLFNAIEGPDNSLWIAGAPGIVRFDGKKLEPYPIDGEEPGDLFAHHILKDRKGNVWIATTDFGIFQCYFDKKHQLRIKKKFSLADGLFTNTFLSMTLDTEDNLWMASYSGVSCIQLLANDSIRIRNFNKEDGFIDKNFHHPFLFTAKDGHIWASGTLGICSFDPLELLSQQESSSVFVTKVDLLDLDSSISFYSSGSNNVEPNLLLVAANNSITIHFTALHYSNPGAVRYYYQLNRHKDNWTEVSAGRSLSFRELAPGTYTLRLKSSVSGNEFGPITSFQFRIDPPFWQRWWFILPCLAFLGFLYFRLLKLREKNIREREAEKTELQKLKAISYQYQLEIEQVINYFATSMSEQRTVDDMLWDVSKNCISKLGFEDCVIYLKDPAREVLIQKAAWGPKTTDENKIVNPIEIPIGKGIVGSVATTGVAEIVADTSMDGRYIVDDTSRLSELTVPILKNGSVIGVIDSEHSEKDFYTERHLKILTTIASLIADKMDKMKAEKEVREREIQLITLNRDLATSQLTALRAQMNPHFIFNALNSIQQYILKGDVDQANKYLSKFSRLQREVLNHCDQNFISLDKEIEMLNLYLELEQLRFSENFEYAISMEKEIDSAELKIPPMILQPFVENAIWHGLMPKKGSKELSIEFLLSSEDLLQCIIRDNGIGRVEAARLKETSKSAPTHKSKGLNLVYERLNILEKQYQQPFEVVISDLTNAAGEVQGTKVTLTLFVGV